MEHTKKCKACGGNLLLEKFKPDKRSTDTLATICTSCLDDRERRIEIPAVYEQMFVKQDQCCAICKRRVFISQILVDYDRADMYEEARGLVCRECNRALRDLKRDPVVIKAMLEYLSPAPKPGDRRINPKNGCPEIYARLETIQSTSPPLPIKSQ